MLAGLLICISLGWGMLGFLIYNTYLDESEVYNMREHEFFDPCNPFWLYHNYDVNYLGAIMLTIVFNLMILPITIAYWLYKGMCFVMTVGRKK